MRHCSFYRQMDRYYTARAVIPSKAHDRVWRGPSFERWPLDKAGGLSYNEASQNNVTLPSRVPRLKVFLSLEIVDSLVRDWKILLVDTFALYFV